MKLEHAGNTKMQARYRQVSRGCFQVLERGLGMRVRVKSVLSLLYIDSTLQYMVQPKSPENLLLGRLSRGLVGCVKQLEGAASVTGATEVLHHQHQQLEGFVEPVEPAAGVLKACVGFLPRAASNAGAGTGEDVCQLCQQPLECEHTPGCE